MDFARSYAAWPEWTRPGPPVGALSEVRTRRVLALALDLVVLGVFFLVCLTFALLAGIATFGLTWIFIPILFPALALAYNGAFISGWRMATPGMRAFDLEMRLTDGTRPPLLNAAAHVVFFYLSWTMLTPLILLVSFVARDKRCLHDVLAGVVVTRRL